MGETPSYTKNAVKKYRSKFDIVQVRFPKGTREKMSNIENINDYIYLCLDNDEAGNERCRQLVSLIPEELSVYRLEPEMKDWNECLVAEVPVENMAKQMCWRDAREKPVPVMKMSEVEETVVQWLWYPFIPFGKVTLIQGNPGKGKT